MLLAMALWPRRLGFLRVKGKDEDAHCVVLPCLQLCFGQHDHCSLTQRAPRSRVVFSSLSPYISWFMPTCLPSILSTLAKCRDNEIKSYQTLLCPHFPSGVCSLENARIVYLTLLPTMIPLSFLSRKLKMWVN